VQKKQILSEVLILFFLTGLYALTNYLPLT